MLRVGAVQAGCDPRVILTSQMPLLHGSLSNGNPSSQGGSTTLPTKRLCSIVCPNQQVKKRKKEEEDNGSKLLKHAEKILNLYIIEEEMGLSIESIKYSSQFACLCCYLASLVNTLRSIAFFGVPINHELDILDMGNFVSSRT